MVAQKRGRGAKNQAAAKKAAPAEEQVTENTEAAEPQPTEETGNGQVEAAEGGEETAAGDSAEKPEGEAAATATAAAAAESANAEPKEEEKKEEKVESGKLLVENLPSSCLFDYQEKLKELFSKHGEVISVKRGTIIVTELTTTPTLSAIVEFKNKESLEKALTEQGTLLDGSPISVAVESRSETAVLVGVPYEASTEYVRLLFAQCGEVSHIHEFSKIKYKILRVTFHDKEAAEKALKLDRELRINGFLVTVTKYRDDDEQKQHNANANKVTAHTTERTPNNNKRQHPGSGRGGGAAGGGASAPPTPNNNAARNNNFRPRGQPAFNARANFRGARGRGGGGFAGRGGGAFPPRGGFPPAPAYLPPQPYMGRPTYF